MTDLDDIYNQLHECAQGYREDRKQRTQKDKEWDDLFKNKANEIDSWLTNAKKDFPITPNLLADTHKFSRFCKGEVNTPMPIIEAVANSLYQSAAFYAGTQGSATMEIVTLDQLASKGIGFGGDMGMATDGNWNGSSFCIMLVDMTLTHDRTDGNDAFFFIRNPKMPQQSGWNRGETTTQSQALVNVISQSGDIHARIHNNEAAALICDKEDVGKGWQFKHSTRRGFGGMQHLLDFYGKGSMKIAVALPYIGTGDHGGRFFWHDAIQPAADIDPNINTHQYSHRMG